MKKAKPRIVILSVTQDASTQYVPIMNCIFTAQKNVCVLVDLSSCIPHALPSLPTIAAQASKRREHTPRQHVVADN